MPTLNELIQTASIRPLNDAERNELFVLLEAKADDEIIREQIAHSIAKLDNPDERNTVFIANMLESIFNASAEQESFIPVRPVHRAHFLRTAWFHYAAALIILITGVALYFNYNKPKDIPVAETVVKRDINPGYNRAILTLSNGKKIELDSAASETINDGTLSIKNNNGQLIYSGLGSNVSEKPPIPSNGGVDGRMPGRGGLAGAGYNTMTTPKGGQYQLTLSDGTRVWLNAASSITYPTIFLNKTREVTITGEVYFEVAKNKQKPFIVKTITDKITVLGTSFNINAYEDESYVKTSLLEGAVKIGDTNIKPGQAYQNGKIISTDIRQDIAWKNGLFDFNNLSIEEGLRQIARWYDVKIIFDGEKPEGRFGGKINRNVSLQSVIELLDGLGIKLQLKGRDLHVKAL